MSAQRLAPSGFARGFGLIELMIGITLGSILLLGLSEVFSASRTAYNTAQGTAEVQENGRFALDFLERDGRMVGHMGCASDQARLASPQPEFFSHFIAASPGVTTSYTEANYASAPFQERFDLAVQGFEAANSAPANIPGFTTGTTEQNTLPTPNSPGAQIWAGAFVPADNLPNLSLGAANIPKPLANSDVLLLRFFGTASAPVTKFDSTTSTITAPAFASQAQAEPNGMYAIADCNHASVFQATPAGAGGVIVATKSGSAPGNLTDFTTAGNVSAGEVYGQLTGPIKGLDVFQAESMAYYVALPTDGRTAPSLFRINYTSNPNIPVVEEIVEGIDNMQILYGVDIGATPDGGVDAYYTASVMNSAPNALMNMNETQAWQRVGSMRIALLARSSTLGNVSRTAAGAPTGCATVANCYSMLGVNVIPPALLATGSAAADTNYREVYVTTIAMRNRLFGQ
jgi:type IV pilus assembly protein PilW